MYMFATRKACYCAFCKNPRKVYAHKHLSLVGILGLVGLGVVITYTVYKTLDPWGLGLIGMFLIVGELFSQTKWRTSMICRNCGFDPVVYVRNPEQAGLKIKAFLEHRSDLPEYLLRPQVVRSARKPRKGENLSLKM